MREARRDGIPTNESRRIHLPFECSFRVASGTERYGAKGRRRRRRRLRRWRRLGAVVMVADESRHHRRVREMKNTGSADGKIHPGRG